MLSSATTEGSEVTLECLDNGAITFITKPSGSISLDIDKVKERLISEIKGITSNIVLNNSLGSLKTRTLDTQVRNSVDLKQTYANSRVCKNKETVIEDKPIINNKPIPKNKRIDAVVIGASTGGPKALQEVLTKLPENLNVPVFVVQHMPEGFTKVFAEIIESIILVYVFIIILLLNLCIQYCQEFA